MFTLFFCNSVYLISYNKFFSLNEIDLFHETLFINTTKLTNEPYGKYGQRQSNECEF